MEHKCDMCDNKIIKNKSKKCFDKYIKCGAITIKIK